MNIVKKYVGKGKRKTTIGMEREQTTSEYEKAIQYIDQLIQQGDLRSEANCQQNGPLQKNWESGGTQHVRR